MLSIEFFNRWNSGDVGSRSAFVPSPRSYLCVSGCGVRMDLMSSGVFLWKKKLLHLSHRCSASWFFSRSLVQNPFPLKISILDQTSIWISLATPTSLAGPVLLPHPAWSSPLPVVWFPLGAVSFPPPPADLEFLTLFTAFLCLHFHFFTFTFTFFYLLSLSHFRSEANLLTLGYSHRCRHLGLVMEEKRLLQPDVYHQQTDYTNTL